MTNTALIVLPSAAVAFGVARSLGAVFGSSAVAYPPVLWPRPNPLAERVGVGAAVEAVCPSPRPGADQNP